MLILVTLKGWAQIEDEPLQLLLQQGDSCMEQYSTYQAQKYYQQAYALCDNSTTRQKLANCYYKRANYHQCAELLKNLEEDSLTHQAFRQLAYSYHKQDNTSSFIYWAGCYLSHYPEAVAAWKEHLIYNPGSIATYYNIANAYAYLLKDYEQAKDYYQQFLTLARKEESPNEQLSNMITASEEVLQYYKTINQKKR